jgi:glycine dehydrogenase subunit 1
MACQNIQKAHYAREQLTALPGVKVRFSGLPFNEFVLRLPKRWPDVDAALRKRNMMAGLGLEADYPDLKDCLLVNVTEVHRREDIDRLAGALREVLR